MSSFSCRSADERKRALAQLNQAKQAYGITAAENAAVHACRGREDAALGAAKKLFEQRNYWRDIALRAGSEEAALRQQQYLDTSTDAELDSLRKPRAEDDEADAEYESAKQALASLAPLALKLSLELLVIPADSPGGDGSTESTAVSVSSLQRLAEYYQQMALLTTQLVENGLVRSCPEFEVMRARTRGGQPCAPAFFSTTPRVCLFRRNRLESTKPSSLFHLRRRPPSSTVHRPPFPRPPFSASHVLRVCTCMRAGGWRRAQRPRALGCSLPQQQQQQQHAVAVGAGISGPSDPGHAGRAQPRAAAREHQAARGT